MRYVFFGLGVLFLLIWAFAFLALHVAGFLARVFLIVAAIFFVLHLARPRRRAP
jgi:NADH:ubiquinone oxidoreductase subunit 3 (subunit A)